MKLEMGNQRPAHFVEEWPAQYDVFSYMDYACGIPSVLHALTTCKANGQPNLCFNAWATFSGDGSGFYAILPISRNGHSYANIKRTGEFCIGFLGKEHYDGCVATIRNNEEAADEIAAGGFAAEEAKTVSVPRVAEAFLSLECVLERETDCGNKALLIGRVKHVAIEEAFAGALDGKYEGDGFMLNINEPIDWKTGQGGHSGVAVCQVVRVE